MGKKKKVYAYIFREGVNEKEVLVFDHPGIPEVNPQIPGGSLKKNETPNEGVRREVFEESGIRLTDEEIYLLGIYDYDSYKNKKVHERYVYISNQSGLADKWEHIVVSEDSDNGEVFHYYWLPVSQAKKKLVNKQGLYLPEFNGHGIFQEDIKEEFYNEDLLVGGINANFSKYFNLKNIAAHYFEIPPGYRTSEPHAESDEEEFVFVISGEIDIWLNGHIKTMKAGDCYGFPAGTGIGHCFINNGDKNCEIFVSGDRTKSINRYHFHLDPALKEICKDKWWDDMPSQILGEHNGLPGKVKNKDYNSKIPLFNGFNNIPKESYSYPGDQETFGYGVCLSRHFKMENVAIWLEKLPPGKRSSWPHAHSNEEEFIYILKGRPTIKLDNELFIANQGWGVDFKAGSGVGHTIINNTEQDVFYLCVGQCSPVDGDKIFYPEHPKRNSQMKEKGLLWEKD